MIASSLSSSANSAAATANWMKRSIFLTSFFSTKRSGSNPFTSPAKWVECCEASKSVIGAAPERPASESLPGLLGADAERGHEPHPGDDDPALGGHVASFGRRAGYFLPECFSM